MHSRFLSFSCLAVMLLFTKVSFAQETEDSKEFPTSIFELSVAYGAQANFFVDYGQPVVRQNGNIIPYPDFFGLNLYQKNRIGDFKAIRFSTRLGGKNYIELGYEVTTNKGTFDGDTQLLSGTNIFVQDFELTHINRNYTLNYKRGFFQNNSLFLSIGFSYIQMEQSEIFISPNGNFVEIQNRNHSNSYLEEGAATLGIQYFFYNTGKFTLGIESRGYLILGAGSDTYLETISLAPVLKFSF